MCALFATRLCLLPSLVFFFMMKRRQETVGPVFLAQANRIVMVLCKVHQPPTIGGVDDITVMGNANTATKCGVDKIFWKNDHESQSDCLGEIRVAKITRNSPVDRNLRLSFADVSFGQGDGVVDLTSRKIFSMFHRSSSVKEGVPLMSATVIAKGEWGEGNYSIQDVSIPPPSPPAAALPPSSAAPRPRCDSHAENIKELLPVFVACILTFTARLHLKTHDVLPGDEFSYHYFIYSED